MIEFVLGLPRAGDHRNQLTEIGPGAERAAFAGQHDHAHVLVVARRDERVGEPHRAVLRDYAEAVAWFGVSALPTVVFNEKVSLVGAVAVEQYRLLLDWMLAGEPGGLIPLDFSDPATGAAGQSPVAASTS